MFSGKKMKNRNIAVITLCAAVAVIGIILLISAYYTTQLTLKLKGSEEMSTGLYSVYRDPGVNAVRKGKDVSDEVEIKGEVDTSVPGTYTLRYRSGNLRAERKITVLDRMDPVIKLKKAGETLEYDLGEKFSEPGFTASDSSGKDLTGKVKVEGGGFNRAGDTAVTYTVSDSEGKTTKVERKVKINPSTEYENPGLPICMYHYVYDENDIPDDFQRKMGNYMSVQALEKQLGWLKDEGYYFPGWEEVREYAEGKLILPEKSIVLCFDDGAESFLKLGIPLLEKYQVPATCFLITSYSGDAKMEKYSSSYVQYQSHSHDMHRPGGNIGHGGIFTAISEEEGMEDLERSIEICGSRDAFAYPFGDFNDSSRAMVEKAGFGCAVTTEYGKAHPGDDPLLLPRIRMVTGQSLEGFQERVRP